MTTPEAGRNCGFRRAPWARAVMFCAGYWARVLCPLARRMISSSGLTVTVTNEHLTGIVWYHVSAFGPGEKLYEELLIGDNPRVHP